MNPWLYKLLCVGLVLALGAWAGYKATGAYYGPKVAALQAQLKTANERADSFEQSYNGVAAAAQKQNDEITKLVAQAQAAADKAKTESAGYQAQAAIILQSQPPAGADECSGAAAARNAFELELQNERGKQP